MNHPISTLSPSSVLYVGQVELELKNNRLVVVCAWCNRVRDTNNNWHTLDIDGLLKSGVNYTHTICNDCKTECLKQVPPSYPASVGLNFGLA